VTGPAPYPEIPTPDERVVLNAALLATGAETGFWDDRGRPAPWPDDIDEWRPEAGEPVAPDPGQHLF